MSKSLDTELDIETSEERLIVKGHNIVLYNDDVSPFEAVIFVLEKFFKKTSAEAMRIAYHVHTNGSYVIEKNLTFNVAHLKMKSLIDFLNELDKIKEDSFFMFKDIKFQVEKAE